MIIVIDESGNPASLLIQNSSDSLCMTAVCIESQDECEKLREKIRTFLNDNQASLHNFKYSKASEGQVKKFIEEIIVPSNVKFISFYQNKVNHLSGTFKKYFEDNNNKREYYLTLSESLSHQLMSQNDIEIMHDSFGWPDTQEMIKQVYTKSCSANKINISKFNFCDSKYEELILIPDILSGLVRDITELGTGGNSHALENYFSGTLKSKIINLMALLLCDLP